MSRALMAKYCIWALIRQNREGRIKLTATKPHSVLDVMRRQLNVLGKMPIQTDMHQVVIVGRHQAKILNCAIQPEEVYELSIQKYLRIATTKNSGSYV